MQFYNPNKKTRFWDKVSDHEIFIYGEICSEDYFDNAVTSKKFAEDFNKCGDNVTIHINSNGGDFFTALAISNLISQSQKNTTAAIDGICASAATLISCACKKITMAENALMMIHAPSIFLSDFFGAKELAKVEDTLNKVRDSILTVYASRTGLEISTLAEMVAEETWLTAQEAKNFSFIDEITGAVDLAIDDNLKYIVLNSLTLKKNYYTKAKEKLEMENQSLIEKIKNLLTGDENSDSPEKNSVSPEKNSDSPKKNSVSPEKSSDSPEKNSDSLKKISDSLEIENKIRAAEVDRIKNLNSLRCENAFVNALIDVAISDGREFEEVKTYVDALKKVQPENKVASQILNLIEDNLNSGAEKVTGSAGDFENKNPEKISADLIAKFAN